jgi:hypothetical protein
MTKKQMGMENYQHSEPILLEILSKMDSIEKAIILLLSKINALEHQQTLDLFKVKQWLEQLKN